MPSPRFLTETKVFIFPSLKQLLLRTYFCLILRLGSPLVLLFYSLIQTILNPIRTTYVIFLLFDIFLFPIPLLLSLSPVLHSILYAWASWFFQKWNCHFIVTSFENHQWLFPDKYRENVSLPVLHCVHCTLLAALTFLPQIRLCEWHPALQPIWEIKQKTRSLEEINIC